VKVVFAGTPAAALPSLQALIDSPRHEVVAVITRPDAPAGRGRGMTASPVKGLALDHDIPALTPARPSDPTFVGTLTDIAPDCCPVVAYGALVPGHVLAIPALGWVNLHFSLLPAWRGAAPVQQAIWHGDEITGASVFRLEEGLDTGPVYGVLTEAIRPRDTAGDLLGRLAGAGARLLTAILDGLEDGDVRAERQPAEGVTVAPKLTVKDAQVDWARPAVQVDRQIRACTPAPGGWSTFRGGRLGVGPVLPVEGEEPLAPGEIRDLDVGTAVGAVRLGTVQPAGKGPMDAASWARGARAKPGERFGG